MTYTASCTGCYEAYENYSGGSTYCLRCSHAETRRQAALFAREADRHDALRDAVGDYMLWEPGRRGHAAAHRQLKEALDA